ncbi:hypothetical protein [Euzebya rosea]|uniref:hypothetical protein n=1 Tax=Euzebya rosea TaxID=2052804 RepID=UPI000D3E3DA2|nr:hypothetical protein [Euzebya rosea]
MGKVSSIEDVRGGQDGEVSTSVDGQDLPYEHPWGRKVTGQVLNAVLEAREEEGNTPNHPVLGNVFALQDGLRYIEGFAHPELGETDRLVNDLDVDFAVADPIRCAHAAEINEAMAWGLAAGYAVSEIVGRRVLPGERVVPRDDLVLIERRVSQAMHALYRWTQWPDEKLTADDLGDAMECLTDAFTILHPHSGD